MKKILILLTILILVPTVIAARDPGFVFCELQGYHQRFSTIIELGDDEIQFIHDYKGDDSLFCLSFDDGNRSTYGCKYVIYIVGDGLEKDDFIKNIFEEKNFWNYTVKKIDKKGYGPWFEVFGPYKEIAICDFGEGKNCPTNDFLNGECGQEYIKELSCVKEGESIHTMFQECCEGLEVYTPKITRPGFLPTCRNPPTNIFIKFWEWLKGIF
ncbi:hypothetical protein JXB28_05045 [Candidatus Woesearchaeota archaeon]|nr:hypothetical protein [Candidatus Woesearchaeota archaeon]